MESLDGCPLPRGACNVVGSANKAGTAERVREDFLSGVRSGVNGTPTFYINGIRPDGSYDHDTLLAALGEADRA